jgi:hypothetical protein
MRVTLRHLLNMCPQARHAAEPTQTSGFSLHGAFIAFEDWIGRHHLREAGCHRASSGLA